MKRLFTFMSLLLLLLQAKAADQTVQAESMTLGGSYAGTISSPFNGVALYANNDKVTGSAIFGTVPGEYLVEVRGTSSSEGANASVNILIDGSSIGSVTFNSSTASTKSIEATILSGSNNQSIELVLTTDDGSSDTYVDWVAVTYLGEPTPPSPAPTVPSQGAFYSGNYRNMFVESGRSSSEVSAKMTQMWNQYFVTGNSSTEKLYYEEGNDMAYILDTGNDDIRSEGMSYGMMICVQMGEKEQFDKLWKFAKTYAQHAPGTDLEGLFSWQVSKNGSHSMMDSYSAPDGEEYYVTALMFADARWGSTVDGSFDPQSDVFDYMGQANYILDQMLDKPVPSSGSCPTALVDQVEKQVVFGICGSSATFTDPSYHLAAFYDIWAIYADNNNQLWSDMADKSRTYLLPNAAHPITGLMPDYSEFDGTPKNNGNHGNFEYDAWRNIMNMGFDLHWFQKEANSLVPLIDRQIDFFKDKPGYSSLWSIDGTYSRINDHSPGLVACNAVGALALSDAKVWPFVDEFFETGIPSGQYRYYDGLLYMMSYMHLSGNFKVYKPDGTTPPEPPVTCTPPVASATATDESTSGSNDGTIKFTFTDNSSRTNVEFSIDGGSTYPTNVSDNTGSTTLTGIAPGTYNTWARWGDDSCPVSVGSVTVAAGGVSNPNQTPYAVQSIPGTIQAEDYDNGGQGFAYSDANTNNSGNLYRSEGVDIQSASDAGGGYNVGWTANGEWLEYTLNSVAAGTYDIVVRVASNNNGVNKSLALSLNSSSLGSASVPYTNGWQSYVDVTISDVLISSASNAVLRLDISGGSYNINYVKFESTGGTIDPPTSGGGTLVQAESNVENYYNLINNNGVIDNISYSHWMKFENVDISGGSFTYRYAKGNNDNGYMKVRIDGNSDANNIATIYPANTGSWSTFQEATVSIAGSGTHDVYLYFHNAYENIALDWIKFGGANARTIANELTETTFDSFEVYPNPSSGSFEIRTSNISSNAEVHITDLMGRTVRSYQNIQAGVMSISELPKGVFIVKVIDINQIMIKKVRVE
ncbi:MAG: glycosyl hydrolase family 8 [Reichenbachiella sp.]